MGREEEYSDNVDHNNVGHKNLRFAAEMFKRNNIEAFLGPAFIQHKENLSRVQFKVDEITLREKGLTLMNANSPNFTNYTFRYADVGVQDNSKPTNRYVDGLIRQEVDQANFSSLQSGSPVTIVKIDLSKTDVNTEFSGKLKILDALLEFH